ncbi:hypothetical protein EDB83DRAFT_2527343 [Lactarius deliciosus]|nr:hypothetical protein EDB83DRAFT_2527343 [Lactarius deliciosus]
MTAWFMIENWPWYRLKYSAGQLGKAEEHFAAVAADVGALESTKALNADDSNYAAVNNTVALLGQGRLKEGIEVLEAALETSPSTLAMAEPFLFNLSDKKRELLIEVAKWSSNGLRTTCLKMST